MAQPHDQQAQARYRANNPYNAATAQSSSTTTPGWNSGNMRTEPQAQADFAAVPGRKPVPMHANQAMQETHIDQSAQEFREKNPTTHTSSVRQDLKNEKPAQPIKAVADSTSTGGFSVMDMLRVLAGLLVLSAGMSYLSTSGESMTWGYNPWWTRAREWKSLYNGGVRLTDTELLAYDGTDPAKPIYLALNGTIYDVSASPKTYGPGGSYHFFAGRDAARAFLTGCFKEDQTPDLRGVELMYMPVDPEEVEGADDYGHNAEGRESVKAKKVLTKQELKNRYAQELKQARKQVREGLEHWHALFRGDKGKPYFKVGEVVREEGWMEKLPKRELCEAAIKSRPVRKVEE